MSVTISGIPADKANKFCGIRGISELLIIKHADVSGVVFTNNVLTALVADAKFKYSFFQETATFNSAREGGSGIATQTITYENIGSSADIFIGNESLSRNNCVIAIAKMNNGEGFAFGISLNLATNTYELRPVKVSINQNAGVLTDTDYTNKTTVTLSFSCLTGPILVDPDLLTSLYS